MHKLDTKILQVEKKTTDNHINNNEWELDAKDHPPKKKPRSGGKQAEKIIMDLLATKSKQNNFVSHFSIHSLGEWVWMVKLRAVFTEKESRYFGGDERGKERDWRRRKKIFAIEERRGEEN